MIGLLSSTTSYRVRCCFSVANRQVHFTRYWVIITCCYRLHLLFGHYRYRSEDTVNPTAFLGIIAVSYTHLALNIVLWTFAVPVQRSLPRGVNARIRRCGCDRNHAVKAHVTCFEYDASVQPGRKRPPAVFHVLVPELNLSLIHI